MQKTMNRIRMKVLSLVLVTAAMALFLRTGVAEAASWSVIPSPDGPAGNSLLSGIAIVSSNDVWAVGQDYPGGGQQQTITEHWNGSQWSVVPSPNPSSNILGAVAAVSTNDVWAVGQASNQCSGQYFRGQALIEHWNGTKWSITSSPRPAKASTLYGIAAASQNDVWAVGLNGSRGKFSTLTEHWNGTQWSIVPSPNPGTKTDQFYAVASGGSDFWAVGYYVNNRDYHNQTLTELYS